MVHKKSYFFCPVSVLVDSGERSLPFELLVYTVVENGYSSTPNEIFFSKIRSQNIYGILNLSN